MEKDTLKNKKKEVLSEILKNIKLKDAGIKPNKRNKNEDCCIGGPNGTRYPNLYLNLKEVPQLKGYEVGDKVMMVIEAEIVGHSKNDDMKSSRESFDLSLKRIGCQEKNEDMED